MGVKVREIPKQSGNWYIVIDHRGERRSKKIGPSKAAAEKVAEQVRANLVLGRPLLGKGDKPTVPTLGQYYIGFKERYMKTAIRESTSRVYDTCFRNQTLPQLGRLRLDQINREHMEEFIAVMMKKELARDYIKSVLSSFRVLMNNALEKDIINSNPVRGLSKFYRQAPVRHAEIGPLNEEESLLFLRTTLKWEPKHYPMFLTSLHTGMRSGEVIGLQWPDIDWYGKFVDVRRQIVLGKVTAVKTKSGRRRVDLSDDLLQTLADLKKQRMEEALKRGSNEISEWVWANKAGRRIKIAFIKFKYFKRVLRKAGLRDIRYHDLRHTYASQLLAQGVPVTYVSQQLGHSNPQITLSVYAHWIPNDSQRKAVNRLPSLRNESANEAQTEVAASI